jgi:hypothetical protein
MNEQERQNRIQELFANLSLFLETVHELGTYGEVVSPSSDDGNTLSDIFQEIIELKFRPDCDRWRPVTFSLMDRARHRRPYFKNMPSGRGSDTTEWWDESMRIALENIGSAIKEYTNLQRYGRPEESDE